MIKKEDLVKLGLSESDAAKVSEAVDAELKNYVPYERFKEVNDDKNLLKKTLQERDGQLEQLGKSSGDVETLKKQIAELQNENKTNSDKHAAEVKQIRLDSAVSAALTTAKAKNATAVRALLDLNKVSLGEDGRVSGLSEQLQKLTQAEDSSFLFDISAAQSEGNSAKNSGENVPVGLIPAQSKGGSKETDPFLQGFFNN